VPELSPTNALFQALLTDIHIVDRLLTYKGPNSVTGFVVSGEQIEKFTAHRLPELFWRGSVVRKGIRATRYVSQQHDVLILI
jgi:hypothetical protein